MDSSLVVTLLTLAIAAAASPFSLVCFALVLASNRGPRNGFLFILGWIATVILLGLATAALGSNIRISENNVAGNVTLVIELILGVVLLVAWVRRRLHPPAPREEQPPKPPPAWETRLRNLGPVTAFVAGGLVQTWPVMLAAAAEVARRHLGVAETMAYMTLFALGTTAGLWVLEVLALRNPNSVQERFERLRAAIDRHRNSVLNWVYLLGGLWLVSSATYGLAT
ncbi:MAG: GAP family protein [Acidimicrobiia bacterium]